MKFRLTKILIALALMVTLGSYSASEFSGKTAENVTIFHNTDTLVTNRWIIVDSLNLTIVPPSSGVKYYRDGILYLSSSKLEESVFGNHISFGKIDARYAELKENQLENIQPFQSEAAFTYPCEAVTFSKDYNTMYFTKYSQAEGVESIHKAVYKKEDNSWSVEEAPLSFCKDKAIYTHPALSVKNEIMVFASNRAGSLGGMDLFVTQLKNGAWTEPVNLGEGVNSQANELYPYLDTENNLYFSSDGSQGYGGYDIYICKFAGNTWEKPVNLSTPINTRFDDVAFSVSRNDGKSAFYTIKENGGKRSVQLCHVKLNNDIPDKLLTLSGYFTRPDISHMVILALEPAVQATDRAPETAKPGSSKGKVTYRVQFVTSFNPKTRSQIEIEGKNYPVYEHLYSGAYRLCVGEFSNLAQAVELQNLLRRNEYPRASVVAFVNDELSLDPELLKQTTTAVVTPARAEPEKTVEAAKPPVTEPAKVPEEKKPAPDTKKPETVEQKAAPVVTETKKDVVIYRVQFATTSTAKGSYKLNIGGKTYNTFEYQYSGAFRSTVGEFGTLKEATEFQKLVRTSGYPQAFVVAFKNNVRSTDPALFK